MSRFTLLLTFFITGQAFADGAKILVSNQDAAQARIDLMRQAQREIFVEYYIAKNDQTMLTGLVALRAQARRGCKVKILVDGLGNGISDATLALINSEPNMEIRLFNPITKILNINQRLHDKALLVDGDSTVENHGWLITGGRNAASEYFGRSHNRLYNDIDIMVTGKAVQQAREYFLALWSNRQVVAPPRIERYLDLKNRRCPRNPGFNAICSATESEADGMQKGMQESAVALDEAYENLIHDKSLIEWNKPIRDWASEMRPLTSTRFLFDPPDRSKSGELLIRLNTLTVFSA